MRTKTANDLLIVYVWSIALVLIISYVDIQVLRVLLGIPFILFFPGYTLLAALFPKNNDLTSIERVSISFGVSIAVVPLIGLVLNYIWEVQLIPLLFSVTAFIAVMSAIAFFRRLGISEEEAFSLDIKLFLIRILSLCKQKNPSKLDRAVSFILIFAILGIIVTLGYIFASPKVGEKFTEFYILGPEGEAEGYPVEVMLDDNGEVSLVRYIRVVEDDTRPWQDKEREVVEMADDKARIIVGIGNRERDIMGYEVEVVFAGVSQEKIGPIELTHRENWEKEVGLVPQKSGKDQKVEFKLYKIREFEEGDGKQTLLSLWAGTDELSARVANQGQAEVAYQMEVKIEGDEGQEGRVESVGPIVLSPGEAWKQEIVYAYPRTESQVVEFSLYSDASLLGVGNYVNRASEFNGSLLYKEEISDGYSLHMWIDVEG